MPGHKMHSYNISQLLWFCHKETLINVGLCLRSNAEMELPCNNSLAKQNSTEHAQRDWFFDSLTAFYNRKFFKSVQCFPWCSSLLLVPIACYQLRAALCIFWFLIPRIHVKASGQQIYRRRQSCLTGSSYVGLRCWIFVPFFYGFLNSVTISQTSRYYFCILLKKWEKFIKRK